MPELIAATEEAVSALMGTAWGVFFAIALAVVLAIWCYKGLKFIAWWIADKLHLI